MRAVVLLMALVLAASPYSDALSETKRQTFWERLFNPSKPKPQPKKRHKSASSPASKASPARSPTPTERRNGDGYFIVDSQWYANYVTEEMAWDYWIPEDSLVRFRDGKYHVPPVVYRHYEDMVKTPKPTPMPVRAIL